MAKTPNDFRVSLTFHGLRRSTADEIVDAAAKIAGSVQVTMVTDGPQSQRGREVETDQERQS